MADVASPGFADDLLAAIPPAPPPSPEPIDGPVLTLADLYFEWRMQGQLSANLLQSPADRQRAQVASEEAHERFEAGVRAAYPADVLLSGPEQGPVLVRWSTLDRGLEFRRPLMAGRVVVSRPGAAAVAG